MNTEAVRDPKGSDSLFSFRQVLKERSMSPFAENF